METQNLRLPDYMQDDPEITGNLPPLHLPDFESPHAVLIVFADNPNALEFELKNSVVLGRRAEDGDQADIDLAPYGAFPAGVSRMHARLTRAMGTLVLEDLKARNGTYVDNVRLPEGNSIHLHSGQAIQLGKLKGWIYFPKSSS